MYMREKRVTSDVFVKWKMVHFLIEKWSFFSIRIGLCPSPTSGINYLFFGYTFITNGINNLNYYFVLRLGISHDGIWYLFSC